MAKRCASPPFPTFPFPPVDLNDNIGDRHWSRLVFIIFHHGKSGIHLDQFHSVGPPG